MHCVHADHILNAPSCPGMFLHFKHCFIFLSDSKSRCSLTRITVHIATALLEHLFCRKMYGNVYIKNIQAGAKDIVSPVSISCIPFERCTDFHQLLISVSRIIFKNVKTTLPPTLVMALYQNLLNSDCLFASGKCCTICRVVSYCKLS